MDIIYALLPLLIFFIIVTRILQFFLRILGKIKQEQEGRGQRGEKPESSRPSRSASDKKNRDSSSRKKESSSRKKGIPEGFELDLSDIDDKFGKQPAREQETAAESETPLKTETSRASLKAQKKRQEARQQRDRQGELQVVKKEAAGKAAGKEPAKALKKKDLSLTPDNFVRAMIVKEVLSRPRSRRPYLFSYRRRE